MTKTSQKFETMLQDLEQLSKDISEENIGLDTLVEKVEKGSTLVQQMKKKLKESKMKIEKITADMNESPENLAQTNLLEFQSRYVIPGRSIDMQLKHGYRVYFGELNNTIILLLVGGDKQSQKRDIKTAKQYWRDYVQK